jgi:hypothetical protein
MFNIRHRTRSPPMVVGRILSIVLMGLLPSISGLNVPSFSQQENNEDDDAPLILSGRLQ